MKNETKTNMRSGTESWGDKVVCWWYGQSNDVSSWWTRKGRQKGPDGREAKMKAETKPKKTRVDRNEVVVFRWICICLVFRGNPMWYRMIHRDISLYHIPNHAISQDTMCRDIVSISRMFGLISRYRIPSKYFSIPNTIFCPVRCTKFGVVHQESKWTVIWR